MKFPSCTDIAWDTDELGQMAKLVIDPSLFSIEAIFKTAYWFTDKFYLQLHKNNSDIVVDFRSKSTDDTFDLEAGCREFCNMLVDNQTRQIVISETGQIRDTLLKKAFFEAKKITDTTSNESFIPQPNEGYVRDPLKIKDLC